MCPYPHMKKRKPASQELIDRIIDTCVPLVDSVCPFLMQDPGPDPRIPAILKQIKAKNPAAQTIIYTPMADTTPAHSRALINSNALDSLVISFYGPTEAVYNHWQPGWDWLETISNINYLLDYRAKTGRRNPHITMDYINVPGLAEKWPLFRSQWSKRADDLRLVAYDTFHGKVEQRGDKPTSQRAACARLWNSFNLLCNGDVVPCCIDFEGSEPMGNILEEDPLDIWNGPKFEAFRAKHLAKKWDEIDLCRECVVR